jgi:copper resistance protein D
MSDELEAGLIVSRFAHYFALSVLFGVALFPLYGFVPSQTEQYQRPAWLRKLLLGAAVVTFGSGISWLGFTVAGMSGDTSSVADTTALFTLIRNTPFGSVWLFRLLLAAGLVALLLGRSGTWQLRSVLFGSLVLLASIALTGNAGSNSGSTAIQHRLADAVHLVASGAWIGALVVFSGLAMIAVRHRRQEDILALHQVLARFAGVGSIVVASLTLSGMFNPGFFLASLNTAYGQVLLAKLTFFGMMLMLAAANRFWLTPRLSGILAGTRHTALELKTAIWALQVSILAETVLAAVVLATVAVLGALPAPTFQ